SGSAPVELTVCVIVASKSLCAPSGLGCSLLPGTRRPIRICRIRLVADGYLFNHSDVSKHYSDRNYLRSWRESNLCYNRPEQSKRIFVCGVAQHKPRRNFKRGQRRRRGQLFSPVSVSLYQHLDSGDWL